MPPESDAHPVRRLLGWSRLLVLLAVVGSFISSATLMVYGVMRAVGIILSLGSHVGDSLLTKETYGKELIAQSIAIVDMFLMGTVLFIVAAGLYQLFIDPRTSLPARKVTLDSFETQSFQRSPSLNPSASASPSASEAA